MSKAALPLHRPRPHACARRALACSTLLAVLGVVLSGCGSSSISATTADPAGAVPASVALYAGATLRPTGAEQTAALAAGRALTNQADPYLRLLAALQTPGSPQLNYKRDVAPWLGPHAGIFLTSLGSSSSALLSLLEQGLLGTTSSAGAFPFGASAAQGAIVMDTNDAAKARSFLDQQARRAGAHAQSYRGISYQAAGGGVAFAVVDRFAVIGTEAGLHSVIDTTLGGSSLAHASGYAKLLAAAPADALAHIYSNPASAGASPATSSKSGGGEEGLAGLLALLTGTRQANVSLVATGPAGSSAGSLALDADTLAAGSTAAAGGLLAPDPRGAQALAELPGESWLAIGLGSVRTTLAQDVQGLRSLGSLLTPGGSGPESPSTLSINALVGALTTPLGLLAADNAQARRDFASWMGSAGIFASGASLLELKGAVSIASENPALSRAAVGTLAGQLRKAGASVSAASIAGTDAAIGVRLTGLPVVLYIADGRDSAGQTKFVLGIGEASVTAALKPPSTLAGSAPASAAATALGEGAQPSLIVELPPLVSLFEGLGLTEDPSISKFVPYLRAVSTLAGGGHSLGGEVERYRLVVGLQQPTG